MRICIISPYPPQTGGVPVHTESLVDRLSKNHEVHVITYGKMDRDDKENVTFHEIPTAKIKFLRGLSFYFGAILKLKSLCKTNKFDVIHSQYMHPPGTIATKYNWIRKNKMKVVVTAHGSDLISMASGRLGKWVIKWIGNHSDKIICVSDYLAKEARSIGIKKEKIEVIYNGMDEDDIPPVSKNGARKALKLSDQKIVTFAGKLTEAKGADIFIILAEHLVKKNKDILFILIGDGPLMEPLKKRVEKSGLKDQVRFVGSKEHGETLEYMKASNVVVVPSRVEGFGLTALEAALMEVPVIASENGALSEVLSEQSISKNIPHDVIRALSDKDFREAIVKSNLKLAKRFTLKRMCDDTEKLYRSTKKSS